MHYTEVHGVRVPTFIYGTAWKEDATAGLVRLALDAGFRGIDTANQRRHYHEAGVGQALAAAGLPRDDLFLQTKFTYLGGQDHRLPYDPRAPIATQVEQSFASSLEHLGVDRIDSYVLHGPSMAHGLGGDDWEAWEAMARLHRAGRTRLLGVSNVNLGQLAQLWTRSSTKPAIVQNRCFAATGWDRAVRTFCREQGLVYQGFSLLTANREVLWDSRVRAIAARLDRTVPQVIFRFALQVGMTPLTGTTSAAHMAEDLGIYEFALDPAEVETIERLVA
ncbi:MAG TPA: aldo/keto reductase [Candidatus Binatia bacterium]|nr:aldo/keto reductase [Candidatus Binatia bacterium]